MENKRGGVLSLTAASGLLSLVEEEEEDGRWLECQWEEMIGRYDNGREDNKKKNRPWPGMTHDTVFSKQDVCLQATLYL